MIFCGPARDWRYEGIIAGYLNLARATGELRWVEKACRAGDDLVGGQGEDGHYQHSGFESNPGTAGTPHEAAADIGLLLLAQYLREHNMPNWERYLRTAQRNLQGYIIGRLWHADEGRFWDDERQSTFVPNKASTIVEVLCLLTELTGDAEYVERYVRPSVDAVLALQVRDGSEVRGGIAQNVIEGTVVQSYLPYYNARCVPALLAAHKIFGVQRYLDAAVKVMEFVHRFRQEDGSFPQTVFPNGAIHRYPRWIAATGDILRADDLLRPFGYDAPDQSTQAWLLSGMLASGGCRTAAGFAGQVSQRLEPGLPDFRDVLPCTGWADKAFRYLTAHVSAAPEGQASETCSIPCTFRGRAGEYKERDEEISLVVDGKSAYHWHKGDEWASIDAPWAAAV